MTNGYHLRVLEKTQTQALMSKPKGQAARKAAGKEVIATAKQHGSRSTQLQMLQAIKKATKLNSEGKSGKEIADALGVSQAQVSRYLQHAITLTRDEITELHDSEVAFQINTTGKLITVLQDHLIYEDREGNYRADSAVAGQILSALNRRAKIFGIDRQREEEVDSGGDTYNIVLQRVEAAVERGALSKKDAPVLEAETS
jgi:predicted transcriptional regulator